MNYPDGRQPCGHKYCPAGERCAYMHDPGPLLTMPEFRASRGGIRFPVPAEPGSPEARVAEARRTFVERWASRAASRVQEALDSAVEEAQRLAMDVHVYRAPHGYGSSDLALHRLTYVGISLEPALYAIPVIHMHEHRYDPDWDYED